MTQNEKVRLAFGMNDLYHTFKSMAERYELGLIEDVTKCGSYYLEYEPPLTTHRLTIWLYLDDTDTLCLEVVLMRRNKGKIASVRKYDYQAPMAAIKSDATILVEDAIGLIAD